MDEEKARAEHCHEQHVDVLVSEYEPSSEYRIQWRTLAAIFSLAIGNVSASISNTVSFPRPSKIPYQCRSFYCFIR